jgi:cytochrome c
MSRYCWGLYLLLAAASVAAGADTKRAKATTDEAKALLARAATALEKDGDAKALAQFNDPKGPFVDRDLYVFCFGTNSRVTAHRDPAMLGNDISVLKDTDGKPFGAEMVAVSAKGEGTVEYKWLNPVTQKVEPKISFLKKVGRQTCGVGAYKTTK